MIKNPFIKRDEFDEHLDKDPRVVHNIWPIIKKYFPGFGYSKAEIDAFFEGESSDKKQVHWDRITSKPSTYPPSTHSHDWGTW